MKASQQHPPPAHDSSTTKETDIEPIFLTMIVLLSVILVAVVLLIFYRVSNHFFKVKRRRNIHSIASRKSSDYSLRPMMELIAERSSSYGSRSFGLRQSTSTHTGIGRSPSQGGDSRYGLRLVSASNSASSSGQSSACPMHTASSETVVPRYDGSYNSVPRSRSQSIASWTYTQRRPSRSHYVPEHQCRKSIGDTFSILSSSMLSSAENRPTKSSTPSFMSLPFEQRVFRDDSVGDPCEQEDVYLQMGAIADPDGLRSSQSADIDETADGYENMSASWASVSERDSKLCKDDVFPDILPRLNPHLPFAPSHEVIDETGVVHSPFSTATSQFYRYNVHRSFSADLTVPRACAQPSGHSPLTVHQTKRRNFERASYTQPVSCNGRTHACKSLENLKMENARTPPPLPKRSDDDEEEFFTPKLSQGHLQRLVEMSAKTRQTMDRKSNADSPPRGDPRHKNRRTSTASSVDMTSLDVSCNPTKTHSTSPRPDRQCYTTGRDGHLVITTNEMIHLQDPDGHGPLWNSGPRYIAMPVKSPKVIPQSPSSTIPVSSRSTLPSTKPTASSHTKSWLANLRQPASIQHADQHHRNSTGSHSDAQSDVDLPWYSESSA